MRLRCQAVGRWKISELINDKGQIAASGSKPKLSHHRSLKTLIRVDLVPFVLITIELVCRQRDGLCLSGLGREPTLAGSRLPGILQEGRPSVTLNSPRTGKSLLSGPYKAQGTLPTTYLCGPHTS